MTADLTARITEILREHRPGRVLLADDLIAEQEARYAALIAEAAEQHYRPRVETVEQLDALLTEWALAEDGSIFAPRALQEIRDRHTRASQSVCDCLDSDHENVLHDLATDDVPVLLRLIDHLWSPGVGE